MAPETMGGFEGRLTVLVVNDDVAFLQTLTHKLRARGIEVRTAETLWDAQGCDGLEEMDVILLDVRQHGAAALKTLREAKRLRPQARIILLFNEASIAWAIEGMLLGAFDDIPVPFDLALLVKKILLAKAHATRDKAG